MSSLSRILALAQKTDGPVVIYDRASDTDFVLIPGSVYAAAEEVDDFVPFLGSDRWDDPWRKRDEAYWFDEDDHEEEDVVLDHWYEQERRALIEDMSSDQLLDQINRDIAVWRAKEQQVVQEQIAYSLEQDVTEPPALEPIVEDIASTDEWHTPAEILKAYDLPVESPPYTPSGYTSPEAFTGMRPIDAPVALEWDAPTETRGEWSPLYPLETVSSSPKEPIQIEEEPFDPPLYDVLGEQEPLADTDAPVFYDEPIV